jgi:hypothetical protein
MPLNEKEAIEKATADAFVPLYNSLMRTSFSIIEYSDAPDIRCEDSAGNAFNFDVTLTEDRHKDIQAALGRSDHRGLEALRKHLAEVKAGKAHPMEWVSCLQGNVSAMMVECIKKKLQKDYGPNCALVVRDTSRCDWDWDLVADQIKGALNLVRNPYDEGIWVISCSKDKILRLL